MYTTKGGGGTLVPNRRRKDLSSKPWRDGLVFTNQSREGFRVLKLKQGGTPQVIEDGTRVPKIKHGGTRVPKLKEKGNHVPRTYYSFFFT